MSQHIPKLLFGLTGGADSDSSEGSDSGSARNNRSGFSSSRSEWSTESSSGRSPLHSNTASPRGSPRSGLQIVVDKSRSPGTSPRSEYEDEALEPYNATATPSNKTPNLKLRMGHGRQIIFSESSAPYTKHGTQAGVLTIAMYALFQDVSEDGVTLTVDQFHHLMIRAQMHQAGADIELHDILPSSPLASLAVSSPFAKSAKSIGFDSPSSDRNKPTRLSLQARSSSIASDEDVIAKYVTEYLRQLPFRHEILPLLKALDLDGDGLIDFHELTDWVQKGLQMNDGKLERYRASGATESKLVGFLENVVDLCRGVAGHLHDDLYSHDRHGSARLDRNGFIDIVNTKATLKKEFMRSTTIKGFLAERSLKWITEEKLGNLCGDAIERHYHETKAKSERQLRRKTSKPRRGSKTAPKEYGQKRSGLRESESEYDSSSSSSGGSESDDDDDERWEENVYKLLYRLGTDYGVKGIREGIDKLTIDDPSMVADEIESRRTLKLSISTEDEEESEQEPDDSSKSSSEYLETASKGRSNSAVVEVKGFRRQDKKLKKRWTAFFGRTDGTGGTNDGAYIPPPSPLKRPGQRAMMASFQGKKK